MHPGQTRQGPPFPLLKCVCTVEFPLQPVAPFSMHVRNCPARERKGVLSALNFERYASMDEGTGVCEVRCFSEARKEKEKEKERFDLLCM